MKNRDEADTLSRDIALLQNKRAEGLILLKKQFALTYETLKPINLIKSTLTEVAASPEMKNDILNDAIGLGTAFLSSKVLISGPEHPIKKILGTFALFALAEIVSKNTEAIRSTGEALWEGVLKFTRGSSAR